ncbi:MAG: sigma-70 family RNA polymerase sigma factor [Subdoligranulum sp.]|nr:sigma-70 family RNA polymerase sigma factor [Subdoligranulum sp.]
MLRKLALRWTGDEHLAEDAVSAAACRFMDAFDSIHSLDARSLRGYLYRILLTVIAQIQKVRDWEIPMEDIEREPTVLDNVEEFVLGQDGYHTLYEKIDQLPPHYGMYIEMAYIDKLAPEVIAKALNIKTSSLRMMAHRARKALRDLCREESEVC